MSNNNNNNETVIYKAPNKTFDIVERCLELQKWIIDPSLRPYSNDNDNEIIARSASSSNNQQQKRLTAEMQIEITQRILDKE